MDRLYEKAFEYKQTKLWKKLADSQLVAVEHSDGTIGYCSIMGMLGGAYCSCGISRGGGVQLSQKSLL